MQEPPVNYLLTPDHYNLKTAYYLSLPVVIGAVFSNRLAARLSDVAPVHWATSIALALAVFCIYTVDRLFDIRKPGQPTTLRHAFHRRYARLLWQLVAGAALLALVLTFFLPGSVIRFGVLLGVICAGYVLAVYRLPARHPALLVKEPLVAVLYSAGVWGSVWVQRPVISGIEIAEGLMFTAIALQNLLLFSVLETREPGVVEGFSLATAWGIRWCNQIMTGIMVSVLVSAFVICLVTDAPGGGPRFAERSAIILGLMSVVLYIIQRNPVYFSQHERYRWLGDAVFWLPALVL